MAERSPISLVIDGNFEAGGRGWQTLNATATYGDGATVTATASLGCIYQEIHDLDIGKDYTLVFDVETGTAKAYVELGGDQVPLTAPSRKTYFRTFRARSSSITLKLGLLQGGATAKFWRVRLFRGTKPAAYVRATADSWRSPNDYNKIDPAAIDSGGKWPASRFAAIAADPDDAGINPSGYAIISQKANSPVFVGRSGSSSAFCSITIGRTSNEVTLGVAASSGQYSTSAVAGDAVLRTESSSAKLHLQAGTGSAVLTVTSSSVGVWNASPSYRLDVSGDMHATGRLDIGTEGALGRVSDHVNVHNTGLYAIGVMNYLTSQDLRLFSVRRRNSSDTATLEWYIAIGYTDTPYWAFARVYRPDGNSPVWVWPLAMTWDGKVGIGSTGPSYTLDVSGDIRATGGLNVGTATGAGTGDVKASGVLAVSGAGDSYVSGKLGVGTTSPAVKLQVAGGTDAALSGGGYVVIGSVSSTNIVIDDNEIMARNNGAASTLYLQADGGDLSVAGDKIMLYGTGSVKLSGGLNVGTATGASTGEVKASGVLTISGTGNSYIAGSLGIGVTPVSGAKLHISGGRAGIVSTSYSAGQFRIGNPNNAEASLGFLCGLTESTLGSDSPTCTKSWTIGPGVWSIGTNKFGIGNAADNRTLMVIQEGGNVGIGTTSPAVLLSVGGSGANVYATSMWVENNLHVQGNETLSAGGRGRLRVGTVWNAVGLYAEQSSSGAANDLVLGGSSGWVRIGSSTWAQSLRVTANTRINGFLTVGTEFSPSTGQIVAANLVSAGRPWTDSGFVGLERNSDFARIISYTVRLYVSGYGDALTVANNGRVGVGTTSPGARLQVVGTDSPIFNVTSGTWTFVQAGLDSSERYSGISGYRSVYVAANAYYTGSWSQMSSSYTSTCLAAYSSRDTGGYCFKILTWPGGGSVWSNTFVSVDWSGNFWVANNCSALSFTDRTPAYEGDALSDILAIKSTPDGEIDHSTLPAFVRRKLVVPMRTYFDSLGIEHVETEEVEGRDLSAMVSLLTTAVQQLARRVVSLEAAIARLGGRI